MDTVVTLIDNRGKVIFHDRFKTVNLQTTVDHLKANFPDCVRVMIDVALPMIERTAV